MSEPHLYIEDPFRRPKRVVPPRARKLASLSQPPAEAGVEAAQAPIQSDPIQAAAPKVSLPVADVAVPNVPLPVAEVAPVEALKAVPAPVPAPAAKPQAKSKATKEKSGNGPVQAVIVSIIGLALAGYAFNVGNLQTLSDGYASTLNLNAQTQGTAMAPMLAKVLPCLFLLPALLLLYVALMAVASLLRLRRKAKPKSARGPREDFRLSAESRGVGPRVAYQTFLLLEPLLPEGHTLDIGDRLEDGLGLSDQQIRSIRHALLENTHRQFDPGAPLTKVATVLGMMVSAQQAPSRAREPQQPVYLPGDPARKRA